MEILTILIIFGSIFLFRKLFDTIVYLIGFSQSPSRLLKRYGVDTWAVVTGATDGIGKGFA